MIRPCFKGLVSALVLTLVVGCSNPETPQEVASAFWQSVVEKDADNVVAFSTLEDAATFDGFKRDWTDVVPSFGRVVIEDREATIVTRLPAEAGSGDDRAELITYLVRTQDQWLVDYERTGEAILNPSPFSSIMGELSRKAESAVDEFGERLQKAMKELEQSAEDALKDDASTQKPSSGSSGLNRPAPRPSA